MYRARIFALSLVSIKFAFVKTSTSARFTPEIVYAYRPALAPDAKTLAYVQIGEPNQLVLAPVPGGEPTVLASTTAGLQVGTAGPWDAGGDWSPDGTWIAVEVASEQFKDCVE